jgi:hypothetical protein
MKRDRLIIFIMIFLAVSLVGLIVYFSLNSKRLSWSESYSPEDKMPYGTSAIYTLMQRVRSDQEFTLIKDSTHKELPEDPTGKKDTYVFIGQTLFADSADVAKLLAFVKAGNSAFIISSQPASLLFDTLLRAPIEEDYVIENDYYDDNGFDYEDYGELHRKRIYFVQDSSITLYLDDPQFVSSSYELSKKYNFETIYNSWAYFKDGLTGQDGKPAEPIGAFDEGYVNYLRLRYGKGEFYFHSTPLVFTNFNLRNDTAMRHCRDALAYFGDGHIYWDEDNRNYDIGGMTSSTNEQPDKPSEGPLEFILSEPSLRAAWYLLMAAVLLYLFFGARRKQRIIANQEKMDNTSIEYAQVLSQMFMKQQDHRKLVLMKMELFKSHVRDRYGIRMPLKQEEENELLFKEISSKSGIGSEHIRTIFNNHNMHLNMVSVDTADMLEFHQMLEHYYIHCK